jgi:hypothetical protein
MAEKKTTKNTIQVRNRNAYKVEIVSNGVCYALPPKSITTLPASVTIPQGRGLIVM